VIDAARAGHESLDDLLTARPDLLDARTVRTATPGRRKPECRAPIRSRSS
jgi:hypothetical protein